MNEPATRPAQVISDPAVMLGKPVIEGTRITVELILRKLAAGFTIDDILNDHRHLTREQVLVAIHHAWELVDAEAQAAVDRHFQDQPQ